MLSRRGRQAATWSRPEPMGSVERLGPDELVLRVDSLAQAGDLRGAAEASALLLQPLAHGAAAPEVLDRVLRAAACLQDACGHPAATSFSSSTLAAARSFLEGAIRCTATSKGSEFSKDPVGAPTLHEALAVAWTTGEACNFVMGQRHMLRANAPASFARMLARWAAHLPAAEGELLLCRACLCTLCVAPQMLGGGSSGVLTSGPSTSTSAASGVASVRALLEHVGELHRAGGAPSLDPAAPLGNFVTLSLDALERRSAPMLTWLVAQYEPRLCDPALLKYVAVVQRRLGLELAATCATCATMAATAGSAPPPPGFTPGLAMPAMSPPAERTSTIDDND